jgi:hypothetical protein
MNVQTRPFLQLGLLLGLLLLLLRVEPWKNESSEARQREFHARLQHEQLIAQQGEGDRIASGEVWVGQIHAPLDWPAETLEESAHQPSVSERVFGSTTYDPENLEVSIELHQCSPGNPRCSSGGSLLVRREDRVLFAMSLGLLQPPDTENHSHYRIEWQTDRYGRHRTEDEKLRLLEHLAVGGLPSESLALYQLVRAAYGFEQLIDLDGEHELRRAIVSTIFRMIVDRRRRDS